MQQRIGDRPDDGAWIHSELDDFGLSVAEFRVYCHILRRAGTSGGYCWEARDKAAAHCQMNHKTYRKSIDALEEFGMIQIEHRPGQTSLIIPLSKKNWSKPHPKEAGGTAQNGIPQSRPHPKEAGGTAQNGIPQSRPHPKEAGGTAQNGGTQNRPHPKEADPPHPKEADPPHPKEADEVYPYEVNTNEVNPFKERDRDARDREEKPVENFSHGSDFDEVPNQPNKSPQSHTSHDQCSAPPPSPKNFEFSTFNWANYDRAGCGGSDPGYWDWAIAQIQTFDSARQSKGEPEIGDITSYTLATIRNRGPAGYAKYLQSIGVMSPPSMPNVSVPMRTRQPDLICSRPTIAELPTYIDLSEEIAIIQTTLNLRSWGWVHPQVQLWVCSAQELTNHYGWPPIKFEPALGCSNWPDWAIAKLAKDLEATCTNL